MTTVFACLLACLYVVNAQMSSCLSSATYSITYDTGTFGCNGYANNVNMIWNVNSSESRILEFTSFSTENNYDKVTLTQGSTVYGPFSGQTNPGSFDFLPGLIVVQFTSDASNVDPGFTIQVSEMPDVTLLQSEQPLTVQPKQDGGFVYFALQGESAGSNFFVDTLIHAYEGLQPPAMFISVNRLPTLEDYDFTNATVPYEDGFQAFFGTTTPRDGTWYIGLFLYGTSTDIDILAQWTYALPYLMSGQKVTNSTPAYYQVLVPTGTTQMVWQISRQLPGGYPIAYIAQGQIPTPTSYGWVMDTSQQSYIKLTISNPNPYNNPSSNPGNYIIAIFDKPQLTTPTKTNGIKTESFEPLTSGFILECDYNF